MGVDVSGTDVGVGVGVDVGGTDVEVGTGVDVGGIDVGVGVGMGGLEVAVGASAAGVGALLSHPTENKIHKTPNINCSSFWRLIFAPIERLSCRLTARRMSGAQRSALTNDSTETRSAAAG
jgi:hypothetical protein